jgi:molybdenum cofactor biosynthesis enzyme MoaA
MVMSYFTLDRAYAFKLRSMPRGSKYPGAIKNSCNMPFKSVSIDFNGNCLLCICDGWLPIPVGQIKDFENFDQLFNSPIAKIIQNDVANKKFTWCAINHCGIANQNILRDYLYMSINIDDSCNLWCPSCRRDKIMHLEGDEFEKKQADLMRIINWLNQYNDPIVIELSGNGDPLASAIIRPLFHNFIPKPTQKFILKTNGLLIKKQLNDSPILPNIQKFSISVDAGTEEVYKKVRCGGSWSVLLNNFEFLAGSSSQHSVVLNYAVQNLNFKDIHNFIKLCKKYNFKASLHQLDDWGTWNSREVIQPDAWTITNGTFTEHNVLNYEHENYLQCKNIIESIRNETDVSITPRMLQLLNIA